MATPGSFTKNLGFGEDGLSLLHQAIRAGFGGRLVQVTRARWRFDCSPLDSDRQLVLLNFFLCSDGQSVVPDELVRLSLTPHTPEWDRVALFALNLGQPGVRVRPSLFAETAWANQFIRRVVANDDGTWDLAKITRSNVDAFLAENMRATDRSRVKVRSNYLYILRLCGITPRTFIESDVDADDWLPSALFLAWDRYLICGMSLGAAVLAASLTDELHKVAGVPLVHFSSVAEAIFPTYLALGGLRRLYNG